MRKKRSKEGTTLLPLAHMGLTVTIVRAVEKRFKMSHIDYRILFIGAILPDLVDKPLGYLLFGKSLLSSRMIGHSLFFLLFLLGLVCLEWYKGNSPVFFTLFLGTITHDILDVMWIHPVIFMWPLYGWNFMTPAHETWGGTFQFGQLVVSKLIFLEWIGGGLLIQFLAGIFRRKGWKDFLREGKWTGQCQVDTKGFSDSDS